MKKFLLAYNPVSGDAMFKKETRRYYQPVSKS